VAPLAGEPPDVDQKAPDNSSPSEDENAPQLPPLPIGQPGTFYLTTVQRNSAKQYLRVVKGSARPVFDVYRAGGSTEDFHWYVQNGRLKSNSVNTPTEHRPNIADVRDDTVDYAGGPDSTALTYTRDDKDQILSSIGPNTLQLYSDDGTHRILSSGTSLGDNDLHAFPIGTEHGQAQPSQSYTLWIAPAKLSPT
jgi:hypothetical protein